MRKKGMIEGNETHVLVFDINKGAYKETKKGSKKYKLNPIKIHKGISIVDARLLLQMYLKPASMPSYAKCRKIIKEVGYLSVMKLDDKRYVLN